MAIFKSKPSRTDESEDGNENITSTVKYDKPKILLIDVESNATDELVKLGFNVKSGTFGKPYRVEKSSDFQQVISKPYLPNHTEQEIVVVDLIYEIAKLPIGEKVKPAADLDFWGKCDHGFIDPRAINAKKVQEDFDRILANGGVFIVFAEQMTPCTIILAQMGQFRLVNQRPFNFSEWSFLSELDKVGVYASNGDEMSLTDQNSPLGRLIQAHVVGGSFNCTLEDLYRGSNLWTTLVKNKFSQAVALFRSYTGNGLVIVLPQLKDKKGFLKSLLTDVLPEMAPHLFPGIEQGRWTNLLQYELPEIIQLRDQCKKLEEKFQTELADLKEKELQVRVQDGWMHDLLTQTGDPLVAAVEMGLKSLGFQNVIDMDKVRDKEGKSRREDLQIQDASPILVIDVKGIANFPSDDDVLQANKHALLLMRELNRTDILGLSLVNHQRHIAPLQRENKLPFRVELLAVALESQLGLMTAWDLYRLVRNARLHQWKYEHVIPLFYKPGRSEIVPAHYIYIGKVLMVWTDKFGVDIEAGAVAIGERISVEFDVLFEESDVEGLMVKNNEVQRAQTGDQTGILWHFSKPKLRTGLRVFRVT